MRIVRIAGSDSQMSLMTNDLVEIVERHQLLGLFQVDTFRERL